MLTHQLSAHTNISNMNKVRNTGDTVSSYNLSTSTTDVVL